jgi:hypothetical protein
MSVQEGVGCGDAVEKEHEKVCGWGRRRRREHTSSHTIGKKRMLQGRPEPFLLRCWCLAVPLSMRAVYSRDFFFKVPAVVGVAVSHTLSFLLFGFLFCHFFALLTESPLSILRAQLGVCVFCQRKKEKEVGFCFSCCFLMYATFMCTSIHGITHTHTHTRKHACLRVCVCVCFFPYFLWSLF